MKTVESVVDLLSLPQQRYIEVVGELLEVHDMARITDVAECLGVSLPSASEVIRRLEGRGYVTRDQGSRVGLTAAGRKVAAQLSRRHAALRRFLTRVMAMPVGRADALACRIEHCVDREFADLLATVSDVLERDYPWVLRGIGEKVRAIRWGEFQEGDSGGGI